MPFPFLIFLGIVSVVYGGLAIVDPKKYTLNTLNDAIQKKMYGEKGYNFLARYVGGPLAVIFGVCMVLLGAGILK